MQVHLCNIRYVLLSTTLSLVTFSLITHLFPTSLFIHLIDNLYSFVDVHKPEFVFLTEYIITWLELRTSDNNSEKIAPSFLIHASLKNINVYSPFLSCLDRHFKIELLQLLHNMLKSFYPSIWKESISL